MRLLIISSNLLDISLLNLVKNLYILSTVPFLSSLKVVGGSNLVSRYVISF